MQRGTKTGAHERRLSGARRSGDGDEMVVAEPVEQLGDVRLAAVEQQRLLGFERPQSGKWCVQRRGALKEVLISGVPIRWRSGFRNGSRSESWNGEVYGITFTSGPTSHDGGAAEEGRRAT